MVFSNDESDDESTEYTWIESEKRGRGNYRSVVGIHKFIMIRYYYYYF